MNIDDCIRSVGIETDGETSTGSISLLQRMSLRKCQTIKQHEEHAGKGHHSSLTIVDSEHMGGKPNGQNVQCERVGVRSHCDKKHNDHLGARREYGDR
jgi:hypothetical protein